MRKILLLTMSILLIAFDMKSYIKELQNKIKSNNSKFNIINYDKIYNDTNFNYSLNLYKKYFSNDTFTINNYKKVFDKKNLIKRKTLILYLFTTNMPFKSYINIFKQSSLIKDKLPLIGILRGMDLKTKRKLDEAFRNKQILFNGRVNPLIFRDLNIKKAPVFIIANCQVKPYFRYKSCKFLYRFDGDVSLDYALSKIGEYDENIKKISMDFYK